MHFVHENINFMWKWRPIEATKVHKWPWRVDRYIVHVLRDSKIYIIGFYFIEHCGLHWRTIWPLMNPPNNIPFWGPGAMYNSLVGLNLKKMKKNYVFEVSRLLEAKPRTFSFFPLKPTKIWSLQWKNFLDPRLS